MKYFAILLLFIFLTQPISICAQKRNNVNTPSGTVLYHQRLFLYAIYTSTDTLRFNQKKSIFRWRFGKGDKIKSKINSANSGLHKSISLSRDDRIGEVNLYDTEKDSMYSRVIEDKIYYLKEKKPKIKWNITDSRKQIGNYTCTKATAWFRGRSYTAWFTPKIPVPYGPWKLIGLPGLILQVYDAKKEIYFGVKKISFGHSIAIEKVPLEGTETTIDFAEYKHVKKNIKKRIAKKYKRLVSKLDYNVNVSVGNVKSMEVFTNSSDQ